MTDGQTDASDLIGRCPTNVEHPKSVFQTEILLLFNSHQPETLTTSTLLSNQNYPRTNRSLPPNFIGNMLTGVSQLCIRWVF